MFICTRVIDKVGIDRAITGRKISELVPGIGFTLNDPDSIGHRFTSSKINLSVTEAMSLGFIGLFLEKRAPGCKTAIAVQIEDAYSSQTEQIFSDGGIAVTNNNKEARLVPFQEASAQNVKGDNTSEVIQDTLIREIARKTGRKRRGDYPYEAGLVITILPKERSSIKVDEVFKQCDVEAFDPTFLVLYQDNSLTKTMVFDLRAASSLALMQKNALKLNFNVSGRK